MLKDITEAQREALPHMEAGNATTKKMRTLLAELNGSSLSQEERAARRGEIEELKKARTDQFAAAQRPMEALKKRYPDFID
jgi:hypothetical protein